MIDFSGRYWYFFKKLAKKFSGSIKQKAQEIVENRYIKVWYQPLIGQSLFDQSIFSLTPTICNNNKNW